MGAYTLAVGLKRTGSTFCTLVQLYSDKLLSKAEAIHECRRINADKDEIEKLSKKWLPLADYDELLIQPVFVTVDSVSMGELYHYNEVKNGAA
jgi:hypothetical protein